MKTHAVMWRMSKTLLVARMRRHVRQADLLLTERCSLERGCIKRAMPFVVLSDLVTLSFVQWVLARRREPGLPVGVFKFLREESTVISPG